MLRTLTRTLINLALTVGAVAVDGWLTTQKAYQHASRDARTATLVAVVVVVFVIAAVLLRLVPSRAQLKKRQQAKRPSFSYATTGRRK